MITSATAATCATGTRPPEPAPGPIGSASDACLLAAVRAGRTAAYGELYQRHAEPARRLARVLVRDRSDAEDLVADAFARVFVTLRSGGGPTDAFRAYLLTAVRHAWCDRVRRERRLELTEDVTRYENRYGAPEREAGEAAVAGLERSYAARAFARLPERWRLVLWHTEVEGRKPASIAPLLGLSPNAVASLACRARERLRQMYLQEHLTGGSSASCRWSADRLGAYVRQGLSRRERSKVDAHLSACPACRSLWSELAEVNSGLRDALAPLVLSQPTVALGDTAESASGAPPDSPASSVAQARPVTRRIWGHTTTRSPETGGIGAGAGTAALGSAVCG